MQNTLNTQIPCRVHIQLVKWSSHLTSLLRLRDIHRVCYKIRCIFPIKTGKTFSNNWRIILSMKGHAWLASGACFSVLSVINLALKTFSRILWIPAAPPPLSREHNLLTHVHSVCLYLLSVPLPVALSFCRCPCPCRCASTRYMMTSFSSWKFALYMYVKSCIFNAYAIICVLGKAAQAWTRFRWNFRNQRLNDLSS